MFRDNVIASAGGEWCYRPAGPPTRFGRRQTPSPSPRRRPLSWIRVAKIRVADTHRRSGCVTGLLFRDNGIAESPDFMLLSCCGGPTGPSGRRPSGNSPIGRRPLPSANRSRKQRRFALAAPGFLRTPDRWQKFSPAWPRAKMHPSR